MSSDSTDLVVREQRYQCPRCYIELEPGEPYDGYCPRCAYDIKGTIDISEDLVDPEKLKEKAGIKEFETLMLMLDNWMKGYRDIVWEKGCDWSIPHEFFQDFVEHMVPYITRLQKTGYATPERMLAIGDKVTDMLNKLIEACQQEEDVMRLGGTWSEQEEQIKLYWQDKSKPIQRLISCSFYTKPTPTLGR